MEFLVLKKIIAEVMNINEDDITPSMSFKGDLGADSIELFHIVMRLEEEFDVEVDEEYALEVVTVSDAMKLIKDTLAI